jgi:hypothetical protein
MKKYILSLLAVLSATTLLTSCNDMLDTDPRKTEMNKETFPGKSGDVESQLAAIYSIMNVLGGGDSDTTFPLYWWEIMSDDCYGSGGLQDNKVKSMHYLVQMSGNQYEYPFISLYGGVKRCNELIENIDKVPWQDEEKALRAQQLGEGYFMRGFYNLWLTQLYGDIPLITAAEVPEEMEAQVSAEEFIYPQIISDFVSGMNLMGTSRGHGDGHANKFAAEAFLARAYMFWAGFYKGVGELANGSAPAINLVEQEGCSGGTLSQADVINALKDIVANGGYKLCKDYRSLWQYSNSLLWDEAHDGVGHAYAFIADMDRNDCFDMEGMGNGNTEELFQIQFMNASHWNIGSSYYKTARQYSCYVSCFWGLRCNGNNGKRDYTYPFNEGWGQGTPSCNIWDDWTHAEEVGGYSDIRKLGSLIDLDHEFEGLGGYTYVKDDCEESGYAVKKFNSVELDACKEDKDTWWSKAPGYTSSSLDNKMQGDHFEDFYLMRYADVLLMLTELTGDAQYMNQVQARAGVPQTPYSLKAVQDERRWEFAFEGLRFNDMRRWSGVDKHSESSYAAKALDAQTGKTTTHHGNKKYTMKHMTCSWPKRYKDTQGFVAKPMSQINLMTTEKLQQNPGWGDETPEAEKTYVTLY